MPTKIEYFELIDSRIEDKTAEGSISKVDVSQSLKDSFDYTDQEVTALSDELYGALDTKADLTSTNDALATKASITYVDTEIDNAIDGLYYDAGNYDASVGTFPTTIFDGSPVTKGATFNVSVAGTLGGISYAQGESFRALVDTPGQTTGNWAKSLYVPLQATEVGLGTVRYATDSEVGSSTGDGVITAGQIPLLPAPDIDLGYKEYSVLLSQTGTSAPTVNVLKNDTGVTPVVGYAGVGSVGINITGVSGLTLQKVQVFITGKTFSGKIPLYYYTSSGTTTITILIRTYNLSNNALENDMLTNTPVSIRLYP